VSFNIRRQLLSLYFAHVDLALQALTWLRKVRFRAVCSGSL